MTDNSWKLFSHSTYCSNILTPLVTSLVYGMMSLLVLVVLNMMLGRMELRNNMWRRRRRENNLICLRQGNLILIIVLMFLNKVSQLGLLSREKLLFTPVLRVLTVLTMNLTVDLTEDLTRLLLYKETLQYIIVITRLRQLCGHIAQHRVHQGLDLVWVLLTDEPPH